MLNPENNASINFVTPELKEWVPAEYEAATQLGLHTPRNLSQPIIAGVGWEDANTELSESARRNRVIAEGREEDFTETWGTLYDIGGDARVERKPL